MLSGAPPSPPPRAPGPPRLPPNPPGPPPLPPRSPPLPPRPPPVPGTVGGGLNLPSPAPPNPPSPPGPPPSPACPSPAPVPFRRHRADPAGHRRLPVGRLAAATLRHRFRPRPPPAEVRLGIPVARHRLRGEVRPERRPCYCSFRCSH